MDVRKWYMSGYIPRIESKGFAKFAAHGFSLIREIWGAEIHYQITDSPTAYFDFRKKLIAIPAWYFLKEGVAKYTPEGDAENYVSLTLINGSTLHEALHARFSDFNVDLSVRTIANEFRGSGLPEQFFAWTVNLVEDLYIEGQRSLNPTVSGWLAAKNSILFPLDKVAESLAGIDYSNPATVLAALFGMKNARARKMIAEVVDETILEILSRIPNKQARVIDREKITVELIRAILAKYEAAPKEEKPDGESKEESETGEGDGETPETGEGEDDDDAATPEPVTAENSDGAEGATKEEREEMVRLVASSRSTIEKIEAAFDKEVGKMLDEEEKHETIDTHRRTIEWLRANIVKMTAREISPFTSPVYKESMSNRFAIELKQLRTVVASAGRAKKMGGSIDPLRLHNSAIDGKVFSTRNIERRGKDDKVEIIFLVDGSGSMGKRSEISSLNLFEHSLAVAYKSFKALVTAGVATKVFVHTSTGGENRPLIVKVADNLTRNFEVEFEHAMETNLSENIDGIVIENIANTEFSSNPNTKKVLVVLSDGTPLSPNYSPSWSVGHTKQIIAETRKSGIAVYSLSLVAQVVDDNNDIYGEENNVDVSKNLDKGMVELVSRIVRRR